jgi:anthranilate synthase/aminodeoxychorismate synthase-like glutamine amidotransferase
MTASQKPRLLLIDNYDSFTYNLVQAFMVLGADVLVHRNDQITIDEARALKPSHLCISPGPGTPYEAGVSMQMIEAFAGIVPVFGVCLGHQSLVEVFGGKVVRARVRRHAGTVRGGSLSLADRAAAVDAGRARSHGTDR